MIAIKVAAPGDAHAVYLVAEKCFNHPWSENLFLSEIKSDKSVVVVAEDNGKIIGFASLMLVFDEGHITNVAVLPEYRKNGIANSLMDFLMDEVRGLKLYMLTLEVRVSNAPAIELYKKKGFVIQGVRANYYTDTNEDALIMSIIYEAENE